MRVGIAICMAAALIPTCSAAKASENFSLDDADMAHIQHDYDTCEKNSGKSDKIMDNLSEKMGQIFDKKLNKVGYIGSKNYDPIIKWAACLVKYTNDGADEELGFYAKFCDSYQDSKSIIERIVFLSKSSNEIRDFKSNLFLFSKNVGVKCPK